MLACVKAILRRLDTNKCNLRKFQSVAEAFAPDAAVADLVTSVTTSP